MEIFHDWQQLYEITFAEMSWVNIVTMGLTYPTWIISYILMLRIAKKDGLYALPLAAGAVMWAYEFCFIFIWPIHKISPEFGYAIYFEVLWLVMDTMLLVQCAMYAKHSLPKSLLAERPWVAVIGTTALATIGMYCFVDWTGMKDGVTAAVLAVALIAVQFPLFVWERQDHVKRYDGGLGGDGISFAAICWRAVGDVFTGLAVFQLYRYVDGSDRPGGQDVVPLCTPLSDPGVYEPLGSTSAFHWSAQCDAFALAPVSSANPFTWFLIVAMLTADAITVIYLLRQRLQAKRRVPHPRLARFKS